MAPGTVARGLHPRGAQGLRTRKPIQVLVIDDSAVIRQILTAIIGGAPDMAVSGCAMDPIIALEMIRRQPPDVITLDVEMPRMDGLTFLEQLMRTTPLPVVMVSALTPQGGELALRALELGAVDVITKPSLEIRKGVTQLAELIRGKIRAAARAHVVPHLALPLPLVAKPSRPADSQLDMKRVATTDRIIAIGASTGGTQALTEIVTALPEDMPGIVIAQHMPPVFSTAFAKRLNLLSRLEVREAQGGERLLRGTVLIAPGDRHLSIRRSGAMFYTRVSQEPPVNYVRPSVDVLFASIASQAGRNAVGVILTGMGEDGARGLLAMREAGAATIAQDEASSIVFGMPKAAIDLGAAQRVLPLALIAGCLLENARTTAGRAAGRAG